MQSQAYIPLQCNRESSDFDKKKLFAVAASCVVGSAILTYTITTPSATQHFVGVQSRVSVPVAMSKFQSHHRQQVPQPYEQGSIQLRAGVQGVSAETRTFTKV